LYFRLTVFHLQIPPLRERRQDILGLVRFFMQRSSRRLNYGSEPVLDSDVENILASYEWPGNVRELENVVDRALILAEDGRITRADLPPQVAKAAVQPAAVGQGREGLREQVRRFEYKVISQAIDEAGGDRRLAAQKLGIGLSSLYRKLEEFEASGLLQ